MENGTIKTKTDRGYGFITREGKDKDLFFHSNSLSGVAFDELKEGDNVQFEVEEGPKGQSAVNVSRVDDSGSLKEPKATEQPQE